MSLCHFVSIRITVAKFIYGGHTDRQVQLRSIKTTVLHVNMGTTTNGYLQMDFVKFRFNKCTSTVDPQRTVDVKFLAVTLNI